MLEFIVLVLVIRVVIAPLLYAYSMKWIEKQFDEKED